AEHGGALLLGVEGICIITHGSSQAPSIFNAIRIAKEAVDNEVLERIQSQTRIAAAQATDGD
ncbi:MAG: phosphate acyltransferase, partial [Crinalium sp.]